MKLPRKLKKRFYKIHLYRDQNIQMNFNWVFHKCMVIVHNYSLAGITLQLTKEDQNFIDNGLLNNPKFKHQHKS